MFKKYRQLIISILIPTILGAIVGLITNSDISMLNVPSFNPPGWLFPIVWTILYALMGVSSYLISTSYSCYNDTCLLVYYLQLIVNLIWSIIFFTLELRLFALIWLIMLDVLVIYMIWCFLGVNKKAAYLQIPYLLWIFFATFLNYSIYVMNR